MSVVFSCPQLDLRQIADSGQCFCWRPLPSGGYAIASGRFFTCAFQNEDRISLSCGPEEFDSYWSRYFDLETDYAGMLGHIPSSDKYLSLAAQTGKGIRILRQEPWEVMVSFLVSQNNNIPRITKSLENLRLRFGSPVALSGDIGEAVSAGHGSLYAFPSPEQLREATLEDFTAAGLGYRAKYLLRLVKDMKDGGLQSFLEKAEKLEDHQVRRLLLELYGIGPKVADCIALFGLHRLNMFPVDTHISAVLSEVYPQGFPREFYHGFCGVMQQYLFYYHLKKSPRKK